DGEFVVHALSKDAADDLAQGAMDRRVSALDLAEPGDGA
ncbi:MAG: hypothetical protein ACKVKG_16890, partial [Alphaproteobacteria bacterium]